MKSFKHIVISISACLMIFPLYSLAEDETGIVLITGSNRGIGLEFTKQYLERGWTVIATARKPEKAEDLKQLGIQYPDRLSIHQLDVTDNERIDELAKELEDQPIDLLLNNAGISGYIPDQIFGRLDYDSFEQVLAVNTVAPLKMAEAFYPHIKSSNLKKIVLECGGKNPAVVFNDAENLDLVAEHIVNGAFWNMGENCSAISRLIVHKEIKSDLLKKILERLRDWKTGDPLDPQNHLGALIDKEHCKKVASYLTEGAVVGGQIEGCFVTPTIYETTVDNKKAKEEIFGPILSVLEVQTNEEAISLANHTEYGLSASIFSANARNALRAARELRTGTVTVNSYGEGDITTPFGGYKQSGFGGRDNGIHAHDQYCEIKTIWIDLTDPASQDKIE